MSIIKYKQTSKYFNLKSKIRRGDIQKQKEINLDLLEEIAELHDHTTALYSLNTSMAEAITGILLREKERLAQENKELKEMKGDTKNEEENRT